MERGVRVVNQNSGFLMVDGIQEMREPFRDRKRARAWEGTRLGCSPPAWQEVRRPAVVKGSESRLCPKSGAGLVAHTMAFLSQHCAVGVSVLPYSLAS